MTRFRVVQWTDQDDVTRYEAQQLVPSDPDRWLSLPSPESGTQPGTELLSYYADTLEEAKRWIEFWGRMPDTRPAVVFEEGPGYRWE